jgi:hypothetical protein
LIELVALPARIEIAPFDKWALAAIRQSKIIDWDNRLANVPSNPLRRHPRPHRAPISPRPLFLSQRESSALTAFSFFAFISAPPFHKSSSNCPAMAEAREVRLSLKTSAFST